MPAHAVWLCRTGDPGSGCPDAFARAEHGWLTPCGSARAEECHGRAGAVPPDHRILTCRLQRLSAAAGASHFALEVPWGYACLDWVFRVTPFPQDLAVLRVTAPAYGFSYLSVYSESGTDPAAQIHGLWIEAQEVLVPVHRSPPDGLEALIPPSLPAIPRVLAHLTGADPC